VQVGLLVSQSVLCAAPVVTAPSPHEICADSVAGSVSQWNVSPPSDDGQVMNVAAIVPENGLTLDRRERHRRAGERQHGGDGRQQRSEPGYPRHLTLHVTGEVSYASEPVYATFVIPPGTR
jgi:hypothetical protein